VAAFAKTLAVSLICLLPISGTWEFEKWLMIFEQSFCDGFLRQPYFCLLLSVKNSKNKKKDERVITHCEYKRKLS
jgi:hypothetical protein